MNQLSESNARVIKGKNKALEETKAFKNRNKILEKEQKQNRATIGQMAEELDRLRDDLNHQRKAPTTDQTTQRSYMIARHSQDLFSPHTPLHSTRTPYPPQLLEAKDGPPTNHDETGTDHDAPVPPLAQPPLDTTARPPPAAPH